MLNPHICTLNHCLGEQTPEFYNNHNEAGCEKILSYRDTYLNLMLVTRNLK